MNGRSSFPFAWEPFDDALRARKRKFFSNDDCMHVDMVRYTPSGLCMPRGYTDAQLKIYNFETRPDDVWVVTYPKCGTTWTQEIVWQMANGVDSELAARMDTMEKVPFVEFAHMKTEREKTEQYGEGKPLYVADTIAYADQLPRGQRRVLKSHLPIEFLPPDLLERNKGRGNFMEADKFKNSLIF